MPCNMRKLKMGSLSIENIKFASNRSCDCTSQASLLFIPTMTAKLSARRCTTTRKASECFCCKH